MRVADVSVPAALVEAIDEPGAVDWWRRAVRTPSVTGGEMSFGRLVAEELRAVGADEVHLEEIAPGRPIVWSVTRGHGGGASLMLCGHLDTVRADGWRERWAGSEREDPFGAAVVDGAVWGRGACDLKGGIATAMGALRALRAAGVPLAGDLVTAWVCDEESGEPGLGRSIGMRAVVDRLASGAMARPDFAVYTEPTSLAVYVAQIGFLIADVEITGRSAYFGTPEEGVDALRAGHRVLAELWRHGDDLRARRPHPLVGAPALLVTEARAGGAVAVAGTCALSLIRSLVPGEDLAAAALDIKAAAERGVEGSGASVKISFPAGRDHEIGGLPWEVATDFPAVRELLAAVRLVHPERARLAGAPFWAEMSFLAANGVPCVYWAPGDIATCHTTEEHVEIAEFVAAVRALTLFIAGYCGAGPIEGGHR
jgi:acetylornithine deacetylase